MPDKRPNWLRWLLVKLGVAKAAPSDTYRTVYVNHFQRHLPPAGAPADPNQHNLLPLHQQKPLPHRLSSASAAAQGSLSRANAALPAAEEKYPDNRIVSSKYTAWNFLPKNLFEQFRRIANFYFLCVGIIQLSIDSPVSPVTSIAPLIFVVSVTAIKQAYEDWLRHKADLQVNNRSVRVLKDGQLQRVQAKHIQVGDIVYVVDEHKFPCDLVMLASSNDDGRCSVTTANLDGETNLKVFRCSPATQALQTVEALSALRATIQCEQPTTDLYLFRGRLLIHSDRELNASTPYMTSLSQQNLLLNGARLKNTRFVFGCAVYTGQQTKMALNSVYTSKNKWSTIERGMNEFLGFFLLLLLLEVAVCTGLKYWLTAQPRGHPWYSPLPQDPETRVTAKGVIQDVFAFLVLFNYIIPISLYVTLELQKFLGAKFLVWDVELFDKERNLPAKVNSSDLNEELGQVEYLFSDKTGTLTENDMIFRKCAVGERVFGDVGGRLMEVFEGNTQDYLVDLTEPELQRFMLLLVLCHTVEVSQVPLLPTSSENLKGKGRRKGRSFSDESMRLRHAKGEVFYEGASPDETALVLACRRYGVVFKDHKDGHHVVSYLGEESRYEVLRVLEFDADRKRMSVVVRLDEYRVVLLVKGAETAVLPRVTAGDVERMQRHVDAFAQEGLRTLVMAERQMGNEEWIAFLDDLNEASNLLVDRETRVREVYEDLESNLTLLGASGVEDRLQDGVAETLEALRVAGIRSWILTGDKQETAVNVSYSCGHFKKSMLELHLTKCEDVSTCETLLQTMRQTMIQQEADRENCLVVDGASLKLAWEHHRTLLRDVAMGCVAVLCCRMSPIQKALIVRMIKDSPKHPITAAIGDGANDVSMIQEAHVGLGIYGKEGRQAARAADFSFGRFRMLSKIFLVHGHWYYHRVATLVQYFFYKNLAFITSQVFFAFFSAFSAQTVFDGVYLTFYNIIFTSAPILAFGLFEQDVPSPLLQAQPHLYSLNRRNARLSVREFATWNLLGVWHAVVFFFGFYCLVSPNGVLDRSGQNYDMWTFGTAVFTTIILVVNLKILLYARHWNGFLLGAVLISFLAFLTVSLLYNAAVWKNMVSPDMYWVFFVVFANPSMPLCILLLVVAALLPDVILQVLETSQLRSAFLKPFLDWRPTLPMRKWSPRSFSLEGEMEKNSRLAVRSRYHGPALSMATTADSGNSGTVSLSALGQQARYRAHSPSPEPPADDGGLVGHPHPSTVHFLPLDAAPAPRIVAT
ncbi:phospholipid-transporting ATPase IF-like [Paramacrobiotus metropolitanus]|uniref:phospholipid-transporting ATPase IF-like n=1 Tax=Paramacrobiotus metropolitanus TaxID=2943436 RepID=UPI00244570F3|nr:phospholipid-transporting ATPase IF-like [Paramacrobiotus metropolitanus]XP_055342477.1 phospholipid-transporting ATPase IF-like [Paramacrobiotus metropolitanus]